MNHAKTQGSKCAFDHSMPRTPPSLPDRLYKSGDQSDFRSLRFLSRENARHEHAVTVG
jgi:hypothetical protein